jgi:NTE family protein
VRPKIGLVLSSGGARGSAHVGVLKVLEENDLLPDVIVGASMGAEVGGAFAAGVSTEVLEESWRSASFLRTVRTMLPTLPWSGWSSGSEVVRFVRKLVGDRRIEDLETPFAAVATDLETGAPHPITRGSLAEAVRASLSVPGLFTPVWIDDCLLIDGGVSNPLPIDVARSLGAERIVAVDVLVDPAEVRISGIPAMGPRQRTLGIAEGLSRTGGVPRRYHPSVFSVLFQMSTVFQKRLCNLTLATHPPDVLIRPDFSDDPPCYSRLGCGIEAGVEATKRALPAIRKALAGD